MDGTGMTDGLMESRWYDPPEGRISQLAGRLQGWLHKQRWPLWRLGNGISTLRWYRWRSRGGRYDDE